MIHTININKDLHITLGRDDKGFFTETYFGSNYNPNSTRKSYSRIYRGPTFKELLSNTPTKYNDKQHILHLNF